jgi:anhydro-N-acetylmuramic acid kinase
MMSDLYLGLMSGTSLDGVDIALCDITQERCSLVHFKEFSFPKELKEEVLENISGTTSLQKIGKLDTRLGVLFASCVKSFLEEFKLDANSIKALGLHGQTLWHEPKGEFPFSMQLGSPSVLNAQTTLKTIADFRNIDIAHGGEGAPFAPAFHQFLFHSHTEPIAVLNIGGMANISLLGQKVLGWDSGCGNVLLDYWVQVTQLKPFDLDGNFAKSGKLSHQLLDAMLSDEYFSKAAPKSTGREYFNPKWLEKHLENFSDLAHEDVQRTLLELTARSIANDLLQTDVKKVLVCGGGAKNLFLMQRLQELSRCDIEKTPNSDALEAMAFAWLAYKRNTNQTVALSSITGAKQNSLLGGIYG